MSDEVEFWEVHYSTEAEMRTFDPGNAAKELIQFVIEARANDVFITDESDRVSIRMKRLGRVELLQYLSKNAGRRLQNHFRAVGGADVTDHLHPVDGREVIELENGIQVDVRISALPNIFGQDLALRLFYSEQALLDLDQLGFLDYELDLIRRLLDSNGGLLLVSGPTGSGKTSSLYAFLRYLNRGDVKIHTLEDPVEFVLPGIVQTQINRRMGIGYAELLHAMMRHSPDVLMIGEIRDANTAEVAVRAAGSGQLVIATVHARTVAGSIQAMHSFGVNPNFLANSLSGVISQRLVRRLCSACSTRVTLATTPSELRGGPNGGDVQECRSFSIPIGCELCSDGYDQMTCVPEIISINQAMRRGIASRLGTAELAELADANGLLSFATSARQRLWSSLSSVEELVKVSPESDIDALVDRPIEMAAPVI